jgi:invasion protein IalB
MLNVTCLSLAAALLAGATVPSLAQSPAAAAPAAQEKKPNDPNAIVCERQESTGSRLASKRICMTRAQWADRRLQDRQELDRVQTQRGAKGE